MDGFYTSGASLPNRSPDQTEQILEALARGASVLMVGETDTAGCLRAVERVLSGSRMRVVFVRPPLTLSNFLEQVAFDHPAADQSALERGFSALTETDVGCDRIVLLVEGAHLSPHSTLHYIEMAMRAGLHLQVVLAGKSPLLELLGLAGFKSLRQRLSVQLTAAVAPLWVPDALPLPVAAPASAYPVTASVTRLSRTRRWKPALAACLVAAGVAGVWLLRPDAPQPIPAAAVAGLVQQPATSLQSRDTADAPPATAKLQTPSPTPAPDTAPAIAVADAPALTSPVPDESLTASETVQVAKAPLEDATVPVPDRALAAILDASASPSPALHIAPDTTLEVVVIPVPDQPTATIAEAPFFNPPAPPTVLAAPDGPGQIGSSSPARRTAEAVPAPAPAPFAQAFLHGAALPVLQLAPRLAREHFAPPRPERVALLAPPQNEHRCRDIVLRAQLGDIPTNADLSFLRNGCH